MASFLFWQRDEAFSSHGRLLVVLLHELRKEMKGERMRGEKHSNDSKKSEIAKCLIRSRGRSPGVGFRGWTAGSREDGIQFVQEIL